jgi:anti-sigma factor RsiW
VTCDEVEANLTDLLEGALAPALQAAALEHLATCDRCEAVLRGTRAAVDLAQRHGRLVLEPAEREQILDRILAGDET